MKNATIEFRMVWIPQLYTDWRGRIERHEIGIVELIKIETLWWRASGPKSPWSPACTNCSLRSVASPNTVGPS